MCLTERGKVLSALSGEVREAEHKSLMFKQLNSSAFLIRERVLL